MAAVTLEGVEWFDIFEDVVDTFEDVDWDAEAGAKVHCRAEPIQATLPKPCGIKIAARDAIASNDRRTEIRKMGPGARFWDGGPIECGDTSSCQKAGCAL